MADSVTFQRFSTAMPLSGLVDAWHRPGAWPKSCGRSWKMSTDCDRWPSGRFQHRRSERATLWRLRYRDRPPREPGPIRNSAVGIVLCVYDRGGIVKRLLFALLSLSSLLVAQSPTIPADRSLILTHVTVIDATGSLAKPDMRVVIRDHKITAIDRKSAIVPPKDGGIVDATGKFLIPGLWDMHVHTGRKDIFLPLYNATAVT